MCPRTLLTAISSCPNDTFCFESWAEGGIDTPFSLDLSFHEIETLNGLSVASAPYDITKVSTVLLPHIQNTYAPLASGAAFAIDGGPLVVAKRSLKIGDLSSMTIAIPGRHTSAFAALCALYGSPARAVEISSSNILQAVVDGQVDAGLVIHEARFVYPSYGVQQIVDIGLEYQSRFHAPLPLGIVVARKSLGPETISALSSVLSCSIRIARSRSELSPFIRERAAELDPATIWQHIHHYVTQETEEMSDTAWKWIETFVEVVSLDGRYVGDI